VVTNGEKGTRGVKEKVLKLQKKGGGRESTYAVGGKRGVHKVQKWAGGGELKKLMDKNRGSGVGKEKKRRSPNRLTK